MEDRDGIRVHIHHEGINYLTAAGVIGLHAEVFGCTNEQARDQLRSMSALESAVARPMNAASYEEDVDIPLQAAYLAHGIAEGQLFLDGNKRTALVAMEAFLELNGCWLTASDDQLADWMLDLSAGLSVYELAKRLHENSDCSTIHLEE